MKTSEKEKYFCIESNLYLLSENNVKKLKSLFPDEFNEDNHSEKLEWIINNSKFISQCQMYNF